jgi:hypothetical protein
LHFSLLQPSDSSDGPNVILQVVFSAPKPPRLEEVLVFFTRHPPVVDPQALKDAAESGKPLSSLSSSDPKSRKLILEVLAVSILPILLAPWLMPMQCYWHWQPEVESRIVCFPHVSFYFLFRLSLASLCHQHFW